MLTTFRTLLRGALRDRISLFFAIVFPVAVLLVLGFVFPSPDYRRQLLAGMLAVSVLFFSLNGIAFESLYQRNSGVYKLLRATPYKSITFITNLTVSRGVVALLSCTLVAIAGVLIFGIALLSWQSILLLIPVMVLGVLCFTFLGLTISNLVQNENQVAMLNNIVTLPMIFTSSTFYSLSNAPSWVSTIGHVLPFSYLIDAEHAAFAGNAGGVVFPLLILFGFTLIAMLLALVTFRWDPNAPPMRRILHIRAG
jgi:ABC-2 type transport system permease protein